MIGKTYVEEMDEEEGGKGGIASWWRDPTPWCGRAWIDTDVVCQSAMAMVMVNEHEHA